MNKRETRETKNCFKNYKVSTLDILRDIQKDRDRENKVTYIGCKRGAITAGSKGNKRIVNKH